MDMHWQKVGATQAARQFSDLLNRVRYRGEHFLIVRNGETVAVLSPPTGESGTLEDLISMLADLPPLDPDFEEDMEAIQAQQPPMGNDPWES